MQLSCRRGDGRSGRLKTKEFRQTGDDQRYRHQRRWELNQVLHYNFVGTERNTSHLGAIGFPPLGSAGNWLVDIEPLFGGLPYSGSEQRRNPIDCYCYESERLRKHDEPSMLVNLICNKSSSSGCRWPSNYRPDETGTDNNAGCCPIRKKPWKSIQFT